jgi:glycosyltransferase involved in cell wall biosynthesis
MNIDISVIIATYNRADSLLETLRSLESLGAVAVP